MQIKITPEYLESQGLSSTFPERFLEKVIITDECWGWKGCINEKGYGLINTGVRGKLIRAHRASFILYVGPIPEGMLICHSCDHPSCSNWRHLFIGTPKDNTQDACNKGRMQKGIGCRSAKLSENDVKCIFHASGKRGFLTELSKKYGVVPSVITQIRNGNAWRHITNTPSSRRALFERAPQKP